MVKKKPGQGRRKGPTQKPRRAARPPAAKKKSSKRTRKVALVRKPKAHAPRAPARRARRAPPHGRRSPAPKAKKRFRLAAIRPEHRPEIEALLHRVYKQAAADLRRQESSQAGDREGAAATQADPFAEARRELMRALQAWEQRQSAPPATGRPRA